MKIHESASRMAMLFTIFGAFALTAAGIDITEPLKTISLMVVSFYFG